MADYKQKNNIPILYLLAIAAIAFSISLISLKLQNLILLFITHFITVLLIGSAIYLIFNRLSGKSAWRSILIYGFSLIFFFPIVGILIATLFWTAIWYFRQRFKDSLFEQYQQFLHERQEETEGELLTAGALARIRRAVGFEPYVDIIRGTDTQMKARAITKLTKNISPDSIQLLKEAAKDPAADVRLYAASALIKIEKELNDKIEKATLHLKHEASAASFLNMAELYHSYAKMGLLDKALAKHYFTLSAKMYQNSFDLDTDQPETAVRYAECLLELENYEKARKFIERVCSLWPMNAELCFLKNEIYFYLGLFSKMDLSKIPVDLESLSVEERELCHFWATSTP